jgi:hypothetical protein
MTTNQIGLRGYYTAFTAACLHEHCHAGVFGPNSWLSFSPSTGTRVFPDLLPSTCSPARWRRLELAELRQRAIVARWPPAGVRRGGYCDEAHFGRHKGCDADGRDGRTACLRLLGCPYPITIVRRGYLFLRVTLCSNACLESPHLVARSLPVSAWIERTAYTD